MIGEGKQVEGIGGLHSTEGRLPRGAQGDSVVQVLTSTGVGWRVGTEVDTLSSFVVWLRGWCRIHPLVCLSTKSVNTGYLGQELGRIQTSIKHET